MTTRIPCGWYVDTMFSTDMSPAWLYKTLLDSLNKVGQRHYFRIFKKYASAKGLALCNNLNFWIK